MIPSDTILAGMSRWETIVRKGGGFLYGCAARCSVSFRRFRSMHEMLAGNVICVQEMRAALKKRQCVWHPMRSCPGNTICAAARVRLAPRHIRRSYRNFLPRSARRRFSRENLTAVSAFRKCDSVLYSSRGIGRDRRTNLSAASASRERLPRWGLGRDKWLLIQPEELAARDL